MDILKYKAKFDGIPKSHYTYDYYTQAEDKRLLLVKSDVSREEFEQRRQSNKENFEIPSGSIRYGDKGTVVIEKHIEARYDLTYKIFDEFLEEFIKEKGITLVEEFKEFLSDYVSPQSMNSLRRGKSIEHVREIMDLQPYIIKLFVK